MSITLILLAVLAVTQGMTTPPSNLLGSFPDHSDNSLLYSLLKAAGFTDSCVSGVLDMCSSAQEEAQLPSLIQEIGKVKAEVQDGKAKAQQGTQLMQREVQEVKTEVREVKTKVQEVKPEVQEVKTKLQQEIGKVKAEVEDGKAKVQEGTQLMQREVREVKTEVQEVKTVVQGVKTEVQEVKTELHQKVQEVKTEERQVKTKVQEVKTKVQEVKTILQQEMRKLLNGFQEFKTTTMKENQNMRAMINGVMAKNQETRQALAEIKEAVAGLSRQVARTPECERGWSKYQSSCYNVFKIDVTHAKAKETCHILGGHLATIGSEGENSFVRGLIQDFTYIGLDDKDQEGVFTWQDGSPFSYSKWASSEPNNYDGNEDCVGIRTSSYWNDYSCTGKEHFVCEKRLQ